MTLQAIKYTRGSLQILDQLRLPHSTIYIPIPTTASAFTAIKTMVVRGAPAIAIVAALSLAVELTNLPAGENRTAAEVEAFIVEKLEYLVSSRPTAVNLGDAARKLKAVVAVRDGTAAAGAITGEEEVVERYLIAAEKMLVDDVSDNQSIGRFGAEWIMANASNLGEDGKVSVLTHCNTGSLATAGYGTALGIIRTLHTTDTLTHAYCTETRPYNQGSRLTAYELVHDRIPSTLLTDSMAASLMQQKKIAAIIVGADRVARNGDTANKIGTYQLAIVARWHGVKFVVAAPRTTVDLETGGGGEIVIEQRPGREVVLVRGARVNDGGEVDVDSESVETVCTAAGGIGVFNPAFDVTPKELIDVIVTERGVAVKDEMGNFNLEKFFE